MPDDDFDRDLARRLRAYESRIPDEQEPTPGPAHIRRAPWAALIGVGGLTAVAGGLLALVLVNAPIASVGDSSPSPEASHRVASPSASEVAIPTPGESERASEPAPESAATTPSPAPTEAAQAPTEWSVTATFTEPGNTHVVNDLEQWADGAIAVGVRYESDGFGVFGPPPEHVGKVWLSVDGRSWEDASPDRTFDDIELNHVYRAADGALILIGSIPVPSSPFGDLDHVAFRSTDARSWERIELDGFPVSVDIIEVEAGSAGWLAATRESAVENPGGSDLWLSTDGRTWERVREAAATEEFVVDIGAGDDGFVAVLSYHDPDSGAPSVIASSDGRTWVAGTLPAPEAGEVAPIGGDWLMATQPFDESPEGGMTAEIWASVNGLDWEVRGEVTMHTFQYGPESVCREFANDLDVVGSLVVLGTALTYGCSEGGFVTAGGAWQSAEGAAWEPLPFGDHASPGGAALLDGTYVIATDGGTGSKPELGVTFWIGQVP